MNKARDLNASPCWVVQRCNYLSIHMPASTVQIKNGPKTMLIRFDPFPAEDSNAQAVGEFDHLAFSVRVLYTRQTSTPCFEYNHNKPEKETWHFIVKGNIE